MTTEPREVAFLIDSDLRHVGLVTAATERICLEAGFTAEDADAVELAVAEALTNVIRHAHGGVAGSPVWTRLRLTSGAVEIRVVDEGAPFSEPASAELPDFDPSRPETLPEGGMGLYLIHTLMDVVERGTEGTANVLRLVKNRRRAP